MPRTIADGQAARHPGELTFSVNRRLVDDVALVSDDEIRAAMRFAFERLKIVVEPSGATALAALLAGGWIRCRLGRRDDLRRQHRAAAVPGADGRLKRGAVAAAVGRGRGRGPLPRVRATDHCGRGCPTPAVDFPPWQAGSIDDDVKAVRDAVPIDAVVSEYLQLRNAGGGNLKGLCPFHDEKSPRSMSVRARGSTTASAARRAGTPSTS